MTRPLRPCGTPGCSQLVNGGLCATHRTQRNAYRKSVKARGYSGAWVRLRQMVLHRDPICRGCETKPSTVADHIIRREDRGPDSLENLQGLCATCHGFKTVHEQRDPTFGRRLWDAGMMVGEPAPRGWRQYKAFGAP